MAAEGDVTGNLLSAVEDWNALVKSLEQFNYNDEVRVRSLCGYLGNLETLPVRMRQKFTDICLGREDKTDCEIVTKPNQHLVVLVRGDDLWRSEWREKSWYLERKIIVRHVKPAGYDEPSSALVEYWDEMFQLRGKACPNCTATIYDSMNFTESPSWFHPQIKPPSVREDKDR